MTLKDPNGRLTEWALHAGHVELREPRPGLWVKLWGEPGMYHVRAYELVGTHTHGRYSNADLIKVRREFDRMVKELKA